MYFLRHLYNRLRHQKSFFLPFLVIFMMLMQISAPSHASAWSFFNSSQSSKNSVDQVNESFKKIVPNLDEVVLNLIPLMPYHYAPDSLNFFNKSYQISDLGRGAFQVHFDELRFYEQDPSKSDISQKAYYKLDDVLVSFQPQGQLPSPILYDVMITLPQRIQFFSPTHTLQGQIDNKNAKVSAIYSSQDHVVNQVTLLMEQVRFLDETLSVYLKADQLSLKENWSLKTSLKPQASLVHELKNPQFIFQNGWSRVSMKEMKVISTIDGLSKSELHYLDDFVTYLMTFAMKPISLSSTKHRTNLSENLVVIEDHISNWTESLFVTDALYESQVSKTSFKIGAFEAHLNIPDFSHHTFAINLGLRFFQARSISPILDAQLSLENASINMAFSKIPRQIFWQYVKNITNALANQVTDPQVKVNGNLFVDHFMPLYNDFINAGSKLHIERFLCEGKAVKVNGQGVIELTPLARDKMIVQANISVTEMDEMIAALVRSMSLNPQLKWMDEIITLKILREIGIPQEGVNRPALRVFNLEVDKQGHYKLNHLNSEMKK